VYAIALKLSPQVTALVSVTVTEAD
jgi:hypothetical protein